MFGTVLSSITLNVGSRFLQSGFLLLQKRLHGHYFQPRVYRWLHDLEKWNRTGKGKKLCLVKCMALNVRWFFRCKEFGDHILKASNSCGFGSPLACLEYWKSNQISLSCDWNSLRSMAIGSAGTLSKSYFFPYTKARRNVDRTAFRRNGMER